MVPSIASLLSFPHSQLLHLLPRADEKAFEKCCEPVALTLGEEVFQPGEAMRHAYFPVTGYISLVAIRPGIPGVEVAMAGSEGMVGTELALGQERSSLLAVVQGAGMAWRVPASDFRDQLAGSAPLQRLLQQYVAVVLRQLAGAAPCVRFHTVGPRLARWMLMTQDRAGADAFPSTHAFMSYMLGVRRSGVSEAGGALQKLGAIHYGRGCVTVLDRACLERAACSCYVTDLATYRDVMHRGTRRQDR